MNQAEKEEMLRRIDMMLMLHSDVHNALPFTMKMVHSNSFTIMRRLHEWKAEVEALEVENPQSRPLNNVDTGLLLRVFDYQKQHDGVYCPIREVNILKDNLNFLIRNGYLNWNAPIENADRVYITSKGKRAIGMPEY